MAFVSPRESMSTATPHSVAGPCAGSNRPEGMRRVNRLQRLVLLHADHRIVVAGHADVGDEARAAGENAMVGARHMRVGADDEARPSVGEVAERPFLAGRLGVHVDDDGVAAVPERMRRELPVERGERVVERLHEDAAEQVDDEEARAVREFSMIAEPRPGVPGG